MNLNERLCEAALKSATRARCISCKATFWTQRAQSISGVQTQKAVAFGKIYVFPSLRFAKSSDARYTENDVLAQWN